MKTSKPKILLLLPDIPDAGNETGGAQRSRHLCSALAEIGDVSIATLHLLPLVKPSLHPKFLWGRPLVEVVDVSVPTVKSNLGVFARFKAVLTRHLGHYWPHKEANRVFEPLLEKPHYDLIVSRYIRPAWCSGLLEQSSTPVIIDIDDVDPLYFRRSVDAKSWTGWRGQITSRIVGAVIDRRSRAAIERTKHVWVSNGADLEWASTASSASVLANIPSKIPSVRLPQDESKAAQLIFVGHMGYGPNLDGIQSFVAEAWPAIHHAVPSAVLHIVGKFGCTDTQQRLASVPGVIAHGYVDDLDSIYHDSSIAISPITRGGGSNIKVLEALAMGCPCVGTRSAFTPFHFPEAYLQGCQADTVGGMAKPCIQLIKEPQRRQQLSRLGYQHIAENHSFAEFQKEVEVQVRRVLAD